MSKKGMYSIAFAMLFTVCAVIVTQCVRSETHQGATSGQGGIILGFSQIGAESAWRKCNTRSIQQASEESGVQLLFANAEQKQENQIKAMRSFIAYQVDVIGFVPIVADGWDNILREAMDAGIPVLVTDRKIHTEDDRLYAGFIGTDSEQEGREAAFFLLKKFSRLGNQDETGDKPVRIIEISGTEGSSVALGRAAGFREALADYPEFTIIHSQSGDFLRSKGYEIMRNLLEVYSDFEVVFSHNDGMTLGILDAMREAGIRPGNDVVIVTIDAEQAAIDALRRGEVNCVIECNPKTGPAIMSLAKRLARGEKIPRLLHVDETVFSEYDDLSSVAPRGY
ncbi:ABC transporter substrate-binding protein [Sediminispirochaeta bajacaliforniensis]|uniref:ABC transporter substrate-binding protein n=1 Tax=Sediminispirochaeta bajacaliforniensis TaxID=148 RepID=UPI00037DEFA4|nr:ABC transporter substrate-binding protein [Sediminispirochaeta bajacaliforniensis]